MINEYARDRQKHKIDFPTDAKSVKLLLAGLDLTII